MGADLAELPEQERRSCSWVLPWPAVRLRCRVCIPCCPYFPVFGARTQMYEYGNFLTEKTIAMDCRPN